MKFLKIFLIIFSLALFVLSIILLLRMYDDNELKLPNFWVWYVSANCIVSWFTFIFTIKFNSDFYYRMEDIYTVQKRYHDAVDRFNLATDKIKKIVKEGIINEILQKNPLPSGLQDEAEKLAKDFDDVDVKKVYNGKD